MSRDINGAYDCKRCGAMFSKGPEWGACPICHYDGEWGDGDWYDWGNV